MLPIYVHFNGQTLSVVLNAKIHFLKKKMLFFYKIDVKVVTNWSERLEKHQTVEILLMVDFLCIFKNVAFLKIFSDF